MISVIVPIYNVDKYLDRCLKSLQNQSFPNFEIIMVDDGSTDQSASVAKSFSKSDNRFIYCYQENGGQGSARNHGIRVAKGDYLCFVDSDDYVHFDYLQLLYQAIIDNNSDISVCGVERVFDNGRREDHKITNQNGASTITDIDNYLKTASFSVCNKMFKRCLFDGLEFPVKLKYEDFALMPRVYQRIKKITVITDILYYYYYRLNSTTVGCKINMDILRAMHILEKSDFSIHHHDVLKIYFIRQVMGTLLWAMSQKLEYKNSVLNIIDEGFSKYPDIKLYMKKQYIGFGKTIWGKMLLKKHFYIAFLYSNIFEYNRSLIRKINSLVKK